MNTPMNPLFDFTMQPGDVVLFQHQTDLGKMIQKVTGSWASHAAFALDADEFIEAADLAGVRRVPLATYVTDPTYLRIQVRRAPGLDVQAAVAEVLTLNGDPYGTMDLLRIYAYEHFHIQTLDQARLDSKRNIICSQLVALGLYAGGVDVRPQFNLHTFGLVTPAMVAVSSVLQTVYDLQRGSIHESFQMVPSSPDPPGDH